MITLTPTLYTSPDAHHRGRLAAMILLLGCMARPSGGASAWGAPAERPLEQPSTVTVIREAAHAADHAWEEFHRAAIGGTLASPAVQSRIERQLHEVRALLMEARKAERAHQVESVHVLAQRIFETTNTIIQSSREKKS